MKLNKRIIRIISEHKASYIGMIALIILSSACFLGFKTATSSVSKNVAENRIKQNLEDASFELAKPLNTEEINSYEKAFSLSLQKNMFFELENGFKGAMLKIMPEAQKINKPKLYKGEYIQNTDDIMVDRYFFEAQKLTFGDKINILGSEYIVCGVFTSPEYLSLTRLETDFMADGKRFGLVVMSNDTFRELSQDDVKINYSVKFHSSNSEKFRRELAKTNYVAEWVSKDTNRRITTFDGENEAILLLSYIAPLFLLIVSSIILAVVLGRMLKKEYTHIGTLSAMGYHKKEIYFHYLHLPIIVSVLGSVIGLSLGFLLIKPFTLISIIEYNVPKPEYHIEWIDILLLLVVPLSLNLLAASISTAKALNINIVALLKSNSSKEKRGFFTRLIPHGRLPFKLRFKLKEIVSNIPRSFLMLVGIIAASIFMITGFLFYNAVDFLYSSSFNKLFGYEYQYVYKAPKIDNTTSGEPFMIASYYTEQNGKHINFTINGIAENAEFIRLKAENGEYIGSDKVVLTKSAARRLGWKKNDTVTIISNATLEKATITIDEICDIRYSDYIYMPIAKLNNMLGLPQDTHIGVYSSSMLNIDESSVSDILTSKDSEAGLDSSIAAFKSFLYILGAFSAVIGMIVVYIVTMMLIEENRKNISMLKVLGYHNGEVSRLLLNSTSIIVWLGFALSVPLALITIDAFFDVLTASMFFDFSIDLKWWQGLISLAVIIGIYYTTLLLAKRKVLNINMAESLKAKE